MLIRRSTNAPRRTSFASAAASDRQALDRRAFLKRSGLTAAALAGVGASIGSVRKADAIAGPKPGIPVTIRKNVCTHCSVGCTVLAEVQNGVWTGQEPAWSSPI